MSEEYANQLFRLAAVLYADNNYEVTPKTIHRKIIESVLLESKSVECTVHQIIDFIHDNYNLLFEEEIIKEIVNNEQDRFLTDFRDGNLYICLTQSRRQTLLSKIEARNIDYFIAEFHDKYSQLIDDVDARLLIHRFLYEIFSSNTSSFQKLINSKKGVTGLINLESTNYTEKEKEIINNFLFWDNADKNKAIFDISSYALEYCMLTNKNGVSSIHLTNLKSKSFYLDTNIIYRTLGINGEDRKKRSQTFLKKFNDAGEKLIISKSTDFEFKEGLKGHIEKISKYNTPRIKSVVYQEVKVQQDIYNFYHKWRIGKSNYNLDRFLAEVLSLYDNFKKEFQIETETLRPYDAEKKNVKEVLDDYTSKISSFKANEGHEIIGSATIDAENILWVEAKRGSNNQNIFDTKYFFISTDQGLRRWDYQRKDSVPTVLLPSQWLSILLRYLDRTDDDFKSFVNFLNLKNNEVLITSERLHIVLAGISEMTEDIIQQRTLLNNLIENKFNGVVHKGISNNEIFENAKNYAKHELEERVELLSVQNEKLIKEQEKISSDLEEHKAKVLEDINQLRDDKSRINNRLSEKEAENKALKEELIAKEVNEEFRKWQKQAYWFLLIGALICFCIYLMFSNEDWEYNYSYKFIKYIDSFNSSARGAILLGLVLALLSGLWKIVSFSWKRLIDKDEKEKKRCNIKDEKI
ncbi:coiled-coil domain-containing protein [Bacteroides sp.]|uniref:coiled-coil domain-containing protein n=1 Tax=Bacteroides sp. TaxID=29523 RepID=UPI003D0EE143